MIKRIIFFGTPDFAVESLKVLLNNGFNIIAVVTTPDKPAGRGLKVRESDVKRFAVSHNLPILQPSELNDIHFHEEIRSLKPDFQVVVAFRKLPPEIFNIPPMGTINLHASLLPDYRGAAPINWAIINGEKETGVSTFYINEKIDEGHILLQEKEYILEDDTAEMLYNKLKIKGADLLVRTINELNNGELRSVPQNMIKETSQKKAPKILKTDCKIDWNKGCREIYDFVRGLSPYPGAYTEMISQDNKEFFIKVFNVGYEIVETGLLKGTIVTDKKTFLKVVAKDGFVTLQHLQLTGKINMCISSFLRGFQMNSEFKIKLT